MSEKQRAVLALIATLLLWSSAFVLTRWLVKTMTPEALVLARQLVMALVAAGFLLVTRQKLPAVKEMPKFLLVGSLVIALYFLFFNKSLVTVDAPTVGFIIAQGPILAAVLALFLLQEKITARLVAGLGLGLCGTYIIFVTYRPEAGGAFNIGLVYAFIACMGTILGFILQRRFFSHLNGFYTMSVVSLFGCLPLLLFVPDLYRAVQYQPFTWPMMAGIIYLGIAPSFIGYSCWSVAIAHLPAKHSFPALYAIPFLVTLHSIAWLGEWPPLPAFAGGLVALLGAAVTQSGKRAGKKAGNKAGAKKA